MTFSKIFLRVELYLANIILKLHGVHCHGIESHNLKKSVKIVQKMPKATIRGSET